ncbi:MAG: DUF4160 domain-containing protein [Betaproteobacteria bacterium]|nr:MAG: DUF4160 domain-containing protein [Betaproteobacteria bacterium]
MSPTVLRAKGFRLFFFSREETRMHVHVQSAEGEAKFWLEPRIELAQSYGLPSHGHRRVATDSRERRCHPPRLAHSLRQLKSPTYRFTASGCCFGRASISSRLLSFLGSAKRQLASC